MRVLKKNKVTFCAMKRNIFYSLKVLQDPLNINIMFNVKHGPPRLTMERLIHEVFYNDEARRNVALQVVKNKKTTKTIARGLEGLERWFSKSHVECLTSDKDWRVRFEGSEVYRTLPERLLEEERKVRYERGMERIMRGVPLGLPNEERRTTAEDKLRNHMQLMDQLYGVIRELEELRDMPHVHNALRKALHNWSELLA